MGAQLALPSRRSLPRTPGKLAACAVRYPRYTPLDSRSELGGKKASYANRSRYSTICSSPTPDDYLALWWHGEVRLPEEALIAWARSQRLLPLLGWRAQQEGWELPQSLTEAIRRTRMTVAIGQVLADRQLKALGEIAQELDIPIVLVKGAAAAEAYPEPWMRPYGDIDLLIAEADGGRLLDSAQAPGLHLCRIGRRPSRLAFHAARLAGTGRQARNPYGYGSRTRPRAVHGRPVARRSQTEPDLRRAALPGFRRSRPLPDPSRPDPSCV